MLLAATSFELQPIKEAVQDISVLKQLDFLDAGVGMVSTAYHLSRHLCKNRYDLAINLGIAGSFSEKFPLGTVVEVHSDCFLELGAEDGENFLNLSQMKLVDENEFPFEGNKLFVDAPKSSALPKAHGITVNKVHGNEKSIEKIMQSHHPDVESMEGAAFMYVCKMEKIPCIQIRAISNYVERRDTSKWRIREALQNLSPEIKKYIDSL